MQNKKLECLYAGHLVNSKQGWQRCKEKSVYYCQFDVTLPHFTMIAYRICSLSHTLSPAVSLSGIISNWIPCASIAMHTKHIATYQSIHSRVQIYRDLLQWIEISHSFHIFNRSFRVGKVHLPHRIFMFISSGNKIAVTAVVTKKKKP